MTSSMKVSFTTVSKIIKNLADPKLAARLEEQMSDAKARGKRRDAKLAKGKPALAPVSKLG